MEDFNVGSFTTTGSFSSHVASSSMHANKFEESQEDEWEGGGMKPTSAIKGSRYETAHVVRHQPQENKKQAAAFAAAVVIALLALITIAIAEITKAARCQRQS